MRLFYPSRAVYFIFAPAWTYKSSGVRALYLLCHALNESGERAFIFPSEPAFFTPPWLKAPSAVTLTNDFYAVANSGVDYIVVYPDIVRRNPLGAKKVVRYLLAPAGLYGGDKTFPETDKVYGYTKDIHPNVLCVPTFDPNIFYPPEAGSKREGAVYYAHKYDKIHNKTLSPLTANAVRLEGPPEEIASRLRKAEVCYLYERSEVRVLAEMCGCKTFPIITDYWDGKAPEEFSDDLFTMYQKFERQLEKFIEDTQKWTQ